MSRNKNKNKPWLQKKEIAISDAQTVNNFWSNYFWKSKITEFPVFTICYNLKEYPEQYVVWLYNGLTPTNIIAVKGTIEEAENAIPKWTYRRRRYYDDDRHVVEHFFEKDRHINNTY